MKTRVGFRRLYYSSAFSQSVFSVTAAQAWNSVPQRVGEMTTYSLFEEAFEELVNITTAICVFDFIFNCFISWDGRSLYLMTVKFILSVHFY